MEGLWEPKWCPSLFTGCLLLTASLEVSPNDRQKMCGCESACEVCESGSQSTRRCQIVCAQEVASEVHNGRNVPLLPLLLDTDVSSMTRLINKALLGWNDGVNISFPINK